MRRFFAFVLIGFAGGISSGAEPKDTNAFADWFGGGASDSFSLKAGAEKAPYVVGATTLFSPIQNLDFRLHSRSLPGGVDDDPIFGERAYASFSGTEGQRIDVSKYKSLPFTLITGSLPNRDKTEKTINAVDVATLPLDFYSPVSELKVLGTGGLSDAASAPGSYMWIAVVEPKTRRGVVVGWLTSNRGSGVIIPKVVDGRLVITARLEYGRLRIPSGGKEELETLAIGWFDDARVGLEAYADAVGKQHKVKLLPQPSGYCTWYHAGSSSDKRLANLSEFAGKNLKPFGFSVIQIDDGWQAGETKNGPRKNFTTHRPGGPYPDGMKPTADRIAKLSMTPGLWLMPFAGTWDDPFFASHKDWFAKREDGAPYDTNWGGTCLDLTRPDVQEYLRQNIQRVTHDWGYKYLKMDGLWTGSATEQQYVNDAYKDDHIGNSTLSNPDKTNIEALRDGLKLVREAAGLDVFLLGCCAPQNMRSYGGAFGLLDAMRIGPDNGATVEGLLTGPRYGTRNYFLHGRVWWNDPDPVYVRRSLSMAQSELSCTWAAIAGQMTIASDELERLPAERLDILKRIMPPHGQPARPVDLFDRDMPRLWIVPATERLPGHNVVGAFNWDQERLTINEPVMRLGLDPTVDYAAFEYWSNKLLPNIHGQLQLTLEPLGSNTSVSEEKSGSPIRHCCAAIAIRALLEHPQLLSTSRHVSQGLVDVVKEDWNDGSHELTGTSHVVGNDPYELRLLLRCKSSHWKRSDFGVSEEDKAKGVTLKLSGEDSDLLRVTIESPESRDVKWFVRFAPANE